MFKEESLEVEFDESGHTVNLNRVGFKTWQNIQSASSRIPSFIVKKRGNATIKLDLLLKYATRPLDDRMLREHRWRIDPLDIFPWIHFLKDPGYLFPEDSPNF